MLHIHSIRQPEHEPISIILLHFTLKANSSTLASCDWIAKSRRRTMHGLLCRKWGNHPKLMEAKWNGRKWTSSRKNKRWLNDWRRVWWIFLSHRFVSFNPFQTPRAFTGYDDDDKDVQIDYPYTLVGFSLYTATSSSSSSAALYSNSLENRNEKDGPFIGEQKLQSGATSRVCEMNKTTTRMSRRRLPQANCSSYSIQSLPGRCSPLFKIYE